MHQLADLYPHQVLNVSYDFDDGFLEEKGYLTHMIGFATTKENPFDDLEQLFIEESLWAIFPNKGSFPATLQETHAKIYSEWLPSSGYEVADLPRISFTKYNDSSENVYSEIWMPIKEKKLAINNLDDIRFTEVLFVKSSFTILNQLEKI